MSCPHGNHVSACDICDEIDSAYKSGFISGKDSAFRESPYWLHLHDGMVVGTSQSDYEDGRYVYIGKLPSQGGVYDEQEKQA